MTPTAASLLGELLPTRLCYPYENSSKQTLWLSFSPQRSGQHLIISWLCTGIGNVLHFNHCRFFLSGLHLELQPLAGRRLLYQVGLVTDDSGIQGRRMLGQSLNGIGPVSNIFYSMEDLSPTMSPFDKLIKEQLQKPRQIVILRDPCNWIASSIKHGRSDRSELKKKVEIYKSLLRMASGSFQGSSDTTFFDYRQFVMNADYRKDLSDRLQLPYFEEAEKTLVEIPDFGGGSSFNNEKLDIGSLFSRWTSFKNDPLFIELTQDSELWKLSEEFFGSFPGMEEMRPK